jgi:nitric oxide reductase subunit B
MGRNMPAKRDLLISRGWIHAILIVRLCGFLLAGILAYRTYTDEPPIPSNVVSVTSRFCLRTGLPSSAVHNMLFVHRRSDAGVCEQAG